MMLSRTGPACLHPKQRTLLRPPPTTSTSLGCSSCSHQVAGFALRTKAFLVNPPPPQSPHKMCIFYEIPGDSSPPPPSLTKMAQTELPRMLLLGNSRPSRVTSPIAPVQYHKDHTSPSRRRKRTMRNQSSL